MVGGLLPVATRIVLVWVGDEVDVGDGEGEAVFGELADSQWSFTVLKMWFWTFLLPNSMFVC